MSMMTTDPTKTVKLFFCYAREDRALRDELEQHLSLLKRQKQITTWYDREISPGTAWEQEIDTHLNSAHLILLLVSRDFLASDYCYGIEMKRALERHEAGTAHVIPIILRPVFWKGAPFSHLQVLPTDALPVTSWPDRERAFLDITENIYKTVGELQLSLKTKEEWLEEGIALSELKRYEEALAAYDQAFRLDPNDAYAYGNKGIALGGLKRYEEALAAFEQAIRLDSDLGYVYHNKGLALERLGRKKDAQQAYERAKQLGYNG
jgi:tetratricopeptide (TPR) repeat protein